MNRRNATHKNSIDNNNCHFILCERKTLYTYLLVQVVEAFFLDRLQRRYLEVELSPFGQHLLLLLDGQRRPIKTGLPLPGFSAHIVGDRWMGKAMIPREYFPSRVDAFNLFAVHNAKSEGDGYKGVGQQTVL